MKDKAEVIRVFKSLDTTGTGKLSKQDVKVGFENLCNRKISESEINKLFSACDTDGSGKLEFTEFIVAATDKTDLLSDNNLECAFRMLDKDGSGSISKKDI